MKRRGSCLFPINNIPKGKLIFKLAAGGKVWRYLKRFLGRPKGGD